MRYFCKHLWRTVRAFPLQPLLILCTVILSVAVSVCAVRMEGMFLEHSESRSAEETRLGDILISLRGDSEVRMLFCEDAKEIAGEGAEVIGEYALTAYHAGETGGELLSASAVDLLQADAYFLFRYTEYGRFTTENLNRSVILSTTAAERLKLHVGDTLSLRLLDTEDVYTVQAIAEPTGLLAERDLLLPISAVLERLAEQAPAIAALEGKLVPYSRLMLRADDSSALFEKLSASEPFSKQLVSQTEINTQTDYILFWQMNIVRLLALLILILSGILISTCLGQLRVRRTGEIALFCSVGASRRHLWLLQLTENAMYALVGSLFGCLLARPLVHSLGALFAWRTVPLELLPKNIAFGVGFAFLLLLGFSLSPLFEKRRELHILEETEPEEEQRRLSLPLTLLTVAALVLFTLLCFALPTSFSLWVGVLAVLLTVRLVYVLAPVLLRLLAGQFERLQTKRPRPSPFLAFRNIKNHPSVAQSARLFAVLFLLMLTLTVCRNMLGEQSFILQNTVQGDLVALSVPAEVEEALQQDPSIAGTMRFQLSMEAELTDDCAVIAVSARGDLDKCIHQALLPKTPPENGTVAVSAGIAGLLGVEVGDSMTIVMQGVPYSFTVAEVQPIQSPLVFLPPSLADANSPLCIRFSPTATAEDTTRVLSFLEANGVMVTDTAELMGDFPLTLAGFIAVLDRTMAAGLVISLVGIANLLAGQYRARKKERQLMRLCGAERRHIAAVCALELVVTILFSLLFAALGAAFLCTILDRVLAATGMTLFV